MALKSTVSIIDYSLLYDRNVRVILWKELEVHNNHCILCYT